MNLRTALFSAVASLGLSALGLSAVAHAQLAAYGTFSAERITGIQCTQTTGSSSPTGCAANGTVTPYGFGGGIYYDFMNLGPARIGFDVRADLLKSNKSATVYYGGPDAVKLNSVLGGVRASFHTRYAPLKPYVQASVGWVKDRPKSSQQIVVNTTTGASTTATLTNYATNNTDTNFFAYKIFAGLDYRLLPIMDVRLPELGIGQILGSGPTNPAGHGTSYPLQSIGVGIVFHLPE
jgi:hypothetical protein